jgi:hypothetical protein
MKTTISTILNQYFEGKMLKSKNKVNNGSQYDFKLKMMTHYPDPFEQKTSIVYKLDQSSLVSLVVYNPEFRCLTYLACGYKEKGYHRVEFDASLLPAGTYVARLRTDNGIVKLYMKKTVGPELVA